MGYVKPKNWLHEHTQFPIIPASFRHAAVKRRIVVSTGDLVIALGPLYFVE